ncbi:MAG: hypothetical protein ACXWT0_03800 [Methylobacter sp.]
MADDWNWKGAFESGLVKKIGDYADARESGHFVKEPGLDLDIARLKECFLEAAKKHDAAHKAGINAARAAGITGPVGKEELVKELTVEIKVNMINEAEFKALDEFLKIHPDIGKAKIRVLAVTHGGKGRALNPNKQVALTVRKDVGEGHRYSKHGFVPGDTLRIKSMYVGKRGDVILTFSPYSVYSVSVTPKDQVEIKLKEACELLDGLWDDLYKMLQGAIQESVQHHRALAEKEKWAKEQKQRDELEAKIAAKAAKYAKRTAFGSW